MDTITFICKQTIILLLVSAFVTACSGSDKPEVAPGQLTEELRHEIHDTVSDPERANLAADVITQFSQLFEHELAREEADFKKYVARLG